MFVVESSTVDGALADREGTFHQRKKDFLLTVDGVLVNGKGIFRQWKSDLSSTVDGVFVLESLTVDGVLGDGWLANGGLLCH